LASGLRRRVYHRWSPRGIGWKLQVA
jgi:hypothetical protein